MELARRGFRVRGVGRTRVFVEAAKERVSGRWIGLAGDRRTEVPVSLRLYSAEELNGLLEGAGFVCRGVCGSLAGVPYDHKATRPVVVAGRV